MPWVGFKLMIPVFERVKTVHALENAATVIGLYLYYRVKLWQMDNVCHLRSSFWGRRFEVAELLAWGSEFWRHRNGANVAEYKDLLYRSFILKWHLYNCVLHLIETRTRNSIVGNICLRAGRQRGVGVRILVGSRIFSSPRLPDRLWGPLNLLSNGYRRLLLLG
jgi:hypothetical protein